MTRLEDGAAARLSAAPGSSLTGLAPGSAASGEYHRAEKLLAVLVFALVLAFAGASAWGDIQLRSLCCADDAYFAIVARHLAEAGRYGLPLASDRFTVFHPEIGSGPALILPGAAMIRLFGAQPWVPSATASLLCLLLFAGVGLTLRRSVGAFASMLFVAVSVAMLFTVESRHWYLSLFYGEAIALGLLLLGAVLLATRPVEPRAVLLAGLALGAAVLTKQIALFCVAGVLLAWWLRLLLLDRTKLLRLTVLMMLAAGLPVLAYEAVRLLTVGPADYLAILDAAGRYSSDPGKSLAERWRLFVSHVTAVYHLGLLALAAIPPIIAVAAWRRGTSDVASRLSVMLLAGGALHLAYILLLSTLWERYLYLGVFCTLTGLAALLLSASRPTRLIAAMALLGLVLTPQALLRIHQQSRELPATIPSLLRTVEFIKAHPGELVISRWWGTFFDVAYLLPRDREWRLLADTPVATNRSFLFVNNERWAPMGERQYEGVKAQCDTLLQDGTFILQRCPAGIRPPS